MKKTMLIATVAMIGVMLASMMLFGNLGSKVFDIGDYSCVDVQQAEVAFEASQSNEDLVLLVSALCWRYKALEDEEAQAALIHYGQLLLDRAKAETIDLEKMDADGGLLQVLEVLRELGVR